MYNGIYNIYRDCRGVTAREQPAAGSGSAGVESGAGLLVRTCKKGYIQACCRLGSGRDGTGVGGQMSGSEQDRTACRRETG